MMVNGKIAATMVTGNYTINILIVVYTRDPSSRGNGTVMEKPITLTAVYGTRVNG